MIVDLPVLGAGGFGAIIGWFVYYLNRHRKSEVQLGDIGTLLGAIGGAAVLNLFEKESELFGAYGVGLFAGFFGYFLVMVALVRQSPNFSADFFLDGRRKKPDPATEYIPGDDSHPMFVPRDASERNQVVVVLTPEILRAAAPASSEPGLAIALDVPSVTAACKAEWPDSKADCSLFARGVASRVGVSLSGNADAILAGIKGSGWTQHANDGVAASNAAAEGKLVIAGITAKDLGDGHGHVVVVVPPTGPLAHGKYPYAYWGSLNEAIRPNGGKGTTLNYSFDATARDKVYYASRKL